jgi:hypothetical protein
MKKIIKEVDEKKGIVQVTIADERWYMRPSKDIEGKPVIQSVPSVTFITGSYPKGVPFYKWLADKGWDESEAIKQAAGNKGSKVHLAIADVLQGKEVRIEAKYPNRDGVEEELTLEECDCILSFVKWFQEVKPKVLAWETVVFSDMYNYAGTVDFICEVAGETWIIDFKTGQYIWPEYELQLSAYRRTIENGENVFFGVDVTKIRTAVLQVGYNRNKNGYKFTEIENKFDLFEATQVIWKNQHGKESPDMKNYPIILSPAMSAEDVIEKPKEDEKRTSTNEAGRNTPKIKTRRA